jgi:hypothetical protein
MFGLPPGYCDQCLGGLPTPAAQQLGRGCIGGNSPVLQNEDAVRTQQGFRHVVRHH